MQKSWLIKIFFGLVGILVIFMVGVYSGNYFTGQTFYTGRQISQFGVITNQLSQATCSTANTTRYYREGGPTSPFLPAIGSGVDVFTGKDYCEFYGDRTCTGVYQGSRLIRLGRPARGTCGSALIDSSGAGRIYYDVSTGIVPSATNVYPSRIRVCCA